MADSQAPGMLLFDLDGTLTDPFVGITRSIGHAMERMGRLAPEPESLRWCIGPPLRSGFRVLLDTEDDAMLDAAVGHYRERYSAAGKFENLLIEGIPQALGALQASGSRMVVATSKLETYAGDIIDHFGLRPYFSAVHGSRQDGSNSAKTDLIRHILETEALSPQNCVMIGDRSHDVIGASANGVAAIGVGWGYAAPGELETAGAVSIAAVPADLPSHIERALHRV